jgi:hypothetical protein
MRASVAKKLFAAILCFAALGGITAVVFLGDTADGTIGVVTTAGKLKVDIVDSVSGKSLVGDVLHFVSAKEGEGVLFSPGETYCTTGFRVVNCGDIPVNFRLSISEDEEIDAEAFRLAFEVWISTDPARVDSAERLTDFKGTLAVGSSTEQSYYLFVKMKESAGNEFQGKAYSGVGVTLYAVQGNVGAGE